VNADMNADKMEDADWPRECEVCKKTPMPRSVYCSERCRKIVEGDGSEYAIRHNADKMEDADWPRECEVCKKTPMPRSVYCSERCRKIVEGDGSEYAIRHRTSKRFLLLPPRLGIHRETPKESVAQRWSHMSLAELEIINHMGEFGGAWEVVPVGPLPHHG
jgi:predicted nucleic acid-binding Zn ribbon protein